MEALLLIDIQNDFLPGGALPVPEGDKIIFVVNLLQEKFGLVVATKDWHPLNHLSFAVNHDRKREGEVIELHGLKQVLWPVHCVEGTPGADFPEGLKVDKIDKIVLKGQDREVDSYSGFFDNGHKKKTDMEDYLLAKGVDKIYLAGLATDYCVKYTALDALQLGFEVYVISDATKAVNLKIDDYESALEEMKEKGAKVIESRQLLG